MIHLSQLPKCLVQSLTLAAAITPTLWSQEPLWFQADKASSPATHVGQPPLWLETLDWTSQRAAPTANTAGWWETRAAQCPKPALPNPPLQARAELEETLSAPMIQTATSTQVEQEFAEAEVKIATADRVPETWIRNAVFARRAVSMQSIPKATSLRNEGQVRSHDHQPVESAPPAIQLSALTLKSGEFASSMQLRNLAPSPLALVTLQPPELEGSESIRQLTTDEYAPSLVVNIEYLHRTSQQGKRLDDDNAFNMGEEVIAGPNLDMKPLKFDTRTMVGPLENSTTLFSNLQIVDRFESYAVHVPANRTRTEDFMLQSPWPFDTYTWISPVFYYKPLYFEQPNLERYGIGTKRWLQPTASSIHFFGSIPLLPYKMVTQHPKEKYYTLGNNRPGDCVPFQRKVILGQSHLGEVLYYWVPGSGY